MPHLIDGWLTGYLKGLEKLNRPGIGEPTWHSQNPTSALTYTGLIMMGFYSQLGKGSYGKYTYLKRRSPTGDGGTPWCRPHSAPPYTSPPGRGSDGNRLAVFWSQEGVLVMGYSHLVTRDGRAHLTYSRPTTAPPYTGQPRWSSNEKRLEVFWN
jgi:hypothetical protein